MKQNIVKNAAVAVLVFILSLAATAAVFSLVISKTGAESNTAAFAGCAAAAVSAAAACKFASARTGTPYCALITSGICVLIMLCVSAAAGTGGYYVPFASPIVCLLAGAAVYMLDSRPAKRPKRRNKAKITAKKR